MDLIFWLPPVIAGIACFLTFGFTGTPKLASEEFAPGLSHLLNAAPAAPGVILMLK